MCTKSPTCPPGGEAVSTISSAVEDAALCDRRLFAPASAATPPPAITLSREGEGTSEPSRGAEPPRAAGRSCGWKTSKFFSRTMSSGEILRGLRKLSLAPSAAADAGWEAGGKPFTKSKSGQLKKRSSCGNDDGPDDGKARSPRSPGPFRPLSKAMSLSEPGSTSRTSSLGIVCKKEDLKAILGGASGRRFPLSSPRKRRTQQAPLRQTKSASFDQPPASEEAGLRKDAVRRSGSEDTPSPCARGARRGRGPSSPDNNERQSAKVAAAEQQAPPPDDPVDLLNARNSGGGGGGAGPKAEQPLPVGVSAVKWDECEVVDAVVLGDAIESFLKGSMSGSEKKVSFRKSSSDKRAKSDE